MVFWKQTVLALLVIVVASGGWVVWHPDANEFRVQIGLAEASDGGNSGGRPGFGWGRGNTLVEVDSVTSSVINQQLNAIGDGAALRSIEINPEVSGRITEVLKTSGASVAAGDVIARLDNRSELIALDRARLAVRDAENRLERLTRMAAGNSISASEKDSAETAVEAAVLQVRDAELALQRREIKAPFAGVLGIVSIEPGSLVNPQQPVARLDDRSDLLIDFQVPERFVSAVREGLTVDVSPVSNPAMQIQATIAAVDNRVATNSRTMRVQALVDNEKDELRPGMSFLLDMRFAGETFRAVNPLAIQWRAEGSYVWRINEENKAERVNVQIVQRFSDSILVESDLALGDSVVIQGVQSVRPGAAVDIRGAQNEELASAGRP